MSKIINKIHGYKPLVYLGEKVVLACRSRIYISDIFFKEIEYVCKINALNKILNFFSRFRLIQRLLRLEMGPAIPLKERGCFLVFFHNKAYHVDIKKSVATQEEIPTLKKKPLQMHLIKSGLYEGSIVFGEYTPNFDFSPVKIHMRSSDGKWSVPFVFPKGEINHVHGIYENENKKLLYILTGDFDQGACIWRADTTFGSVEPILRHNQLNRACWIFPWKEKLIFASDRQDEPNYLCSTDFYGLTGIHAHFPIVGSSIYNSCAHSDLIVFSTTVEPESSNNFSFFSMLSNQSAPGILGNYSCIYVGTPSKGFKIIFSGKKDQLSYGLFQFGSIRFPTGKSIDQNYIHFYCTSLCHHDDVTYAMELSS